MKHFILLVIKAIAFISVSVYYISLSYDRFSLIVACVYVFTIGLMIWSRVAGEYLEWHDESYQKQRRIKVWPGSPAVFQILGWILLFCPLLTLILLRYSSL